MGQAEIFELLSIDPSEINSQQQPPELEVFHRYRVLGKTTIGDQAMRQVLISALNRSIAKSLGGGMHCFNPRHAIHAVHGRKSIDVLICFECGYLAIQIDADRLPMETIARGEQPVFDGMLTAANVPLAPVDH
jgi:hypothetical protein